MRSGTPRGGQSPYSDREKKAPFTSFQKCSCSRFHPNLQRSTKPRYSLAGGSGISDNKHAPRHPRIGLVWRGLDGELAVLDDHPSPTRAKPAHAGLCEFPFEIGKGTECRLDRIGKHTCGLATAALLHDFPEHRMVPVAAAIVPHSGANILWDTVEA